MKKFLLILLMLAIPLQAIAAAERNLTHVLGSGSCKGIEFVVKHIAEHAGHVLHHHDDDSGTHVDSSLKSLHHLADYEQGCSMHFLLPALSQPDLPTVVRVPPVLSPVVFSDRTTNSLLRPPRALV